MFPTIGKDKISSSMAYPVKASAIAEALAQVPQAAEIKLYFSRGWPNAASYAKAGWHHAVITAEYRHNHPSPYTTLPPEHLQRPQWTIHVRTVPLVIKHQVAELIEQEALPRVHDWLLEHRDLGEWQGIRRLSVQYHPETEVLEFENFEHA